jgi:hypothetical protein
VTPGRDSGGSRPDTVGERWEIKAGEELVGSFVANGRTWHIRLAPPVAGAVTAVRIIDADGRIGFVFKYEEG